MSNPAQFLEPVVSSASQVLQLRTSDGNIIASADPVLAICSSLAYSQIVSYINRPLLSGLYREFYPASYFHFQLRMTPVMDVVEVIIDDVVGEKDVDYKVQHGQSITIINEEWLGSDGQDVDLTGVASEKTFNVEISYIAGLATSDTDYQIHNAIVMQTIVNYHRRDSLGLVRVDSKGQGSLTLASTGNNPDLGEVIDAVKLILAPYVYYGNAEQLGLIDYV